MEKRTRRTKAEVAKSKGLLVKIVAVISVKRNLTQCFLIVRINAC
jgi:hypothetical protein